MVDLVDKEILLSIDFPRLMMLKFNNNNNNKDNNNNNNNNNNKNLIIWKAFECFGQAKSPNNQFWHPIRIN